MKSYRLNKTHKLLRLIAFAALVVFALLVGWKIFGSSGDNSDHTEQVSLNKTEDQTVPQPFMIDENKPDTQDTPDTENYLVVKEWDIKLKMQDAEKVIYTYKNYSYAQYGQEASAIILTVRPEYLKDKSCNLSLDWTRYQKLNDQLRDVAVKIGEYYFVNGSQPNNCKNAEDNELYKKILSEFTNIEPL